MYRTLFFAAFVAVVLTTSACSTIGLRSKGDAKRDTPPPPPASPPAPVVVPAPPRAEIKPVEPPKEETAEVIPLPQASEVGPATSVQAPGPAAPLAVPGLPSDPNTFLVTVAAKGSEHPNFGTGHTKGFVVNGVQGKALVVKRGETYRFDVQTDIQHDFYLSTSAVGWGAAVLAEGVKGNFTYKGEVAFAPGPTTPEQVYYQCRNHKAMGGAIYVVSTDAEAASVQQRLAQQHGAGNAAAPPAGSVTAPTETQVKQKIAYGEMLLKIKGAQLEPTRVKAIQDQLARAGAALAAGKLDMALAEANEAVDSVNSGAKNVMSGEVLAEARKQYEERLEGLHSFEKSHEAAYQRALRTKGKLVDYDKTKVDALVAEAAVLAAKQDYKQASMRLNQAQYQVTSALNEMLHQQTVVYDKNFETPKEEFEFELGRYDSYEELIPVAIEQKSPSQDQVKLMESFATKGKGLKDQAKHKAGEGDYKTAILMLQAATENLQRGLRILGVSM